MTKLSSGQLEVLKAVRAAAETKFSYSHISDILDHCDDERKARRALGMLVIKGFLQLDTSRDEDAYLLTDKGLDALVEEPVPEL